MLTKIGPLGAGPASVRAFSTSFLKASRRADYAANLRRDWGDGGFVSRAGVNPPAYSARTIPTKLLFDSLRDLENKHYLANQQGRSPHCRGSDPGAPLYRAAHRALTSLVPDCEAKPVVTISEIENVLSDEAGCKRSPCTHLRRTVSRGLLSASWATWATASNWLQQRRSSARRFSSAESTALGGSMRRSCEWGG